MATAELRSFRTATRTCLPAVVALIVAGFGRAAAAWAATKPSLGRLSTEAQRGSRESMP
jgi:hypothetical protein